MIEWSVSTKKFVKVLIVKRKSLLQMSATLSKQIGNQDLIILSRIRFPIRWPGVQWRRRNAAMRM